MRWLTRLFENGGALGAIVAAMGCASCFPALGSLGAALGLGFLAQYEGLFINTLLPVFAWIALGAALVSFWFHRRIVRALAGVAGPAMVLLSLYPLWQYGWSTYLFYFGLAWMLVVAIWDLVSPPRRVCASCSTDTGASDPACTSK